MKFLKNKRAGIHLIYLIMFGWPLILVLLLGGSGAFAILKNSTTIAWIVGIAMAIYLIKILRK